MISGFSAAKIIVVHGREIVMDQGVCVDHLERRGGLERLPGVQPAALRGLEDERRAQAFAAGEQRVAHRPADGLGEVGGGGEELLHG